MSNQRLFSASNDEIIAELVMRMGVGQKPNLQPLLHAIDVEKDAERRRAVMRRAAKNTPWPAPLAAA